MNHTVWAYVVMALLLCAVAVADNRSQTIASLTQCDSFSIQLLNATLQVDAGEYWFNGCTQNGDVWSCTCSDGDPIVLSTKMTTVNAYHFGVNYTYSEQRSNGGSGRKRSSGFSVGVVTGYPQNITINQTQPRPKPEVNTTKNNTVEVKPLENLWPLVIQDDITTNQTTTATQSFDYWSLVFGFGIGITIIAIIASIVVYNIRRGVKNE